MIQAWKYQKSETFFYNVDDTTSWFGGPSSIDFSSTSRVLKYKITIENRNKFEGFFLMPISHRKFQIAQGTGTDAERLLKALTDHLGAGSRVYSFDPYS